MDAHYFADPKEWRKWLAKNHASAKEFVVGFHKKATGTPSLTWAAAVDEALCFGWIDGIRRRVDAARYTIRFTPRRAGSSWSAVNLRRVPELQEEGRMHAAGLAAFRARKEGDGARYSYEQRKSARFLPEQERRFRSERAAWDFFASAAPSYRQAATWWVVSAKQEATQERRLEQLIRDSKAGRTVGPLTRRTGRK